MEDNRDIEEDGSTKVSQLFEEYQGMYLTEEKYYISILACIMVEEGKDLEEVAAQILSSNFKDTKLYEGWRILDTRKKVGILYGLLCLLAYSCANKVREAAREVVKRVLVFDVRRASAPHANYPIALFPLIKDFNEAETEFEWAIKVWDERKVPLKMDAVMESINILISLIEERQAATIDASYRLLAYFCLYNELQDVPLLTYVVDRFSPLLLAGKGKNQADNLWQWMQRFVHHINSCNLECDVQVVDVVPQDSVITSFNSYTPNNKLMVCALLLRLSMVGTRHSVEVNSIILHIERSNRGARNWGERSSFIDRLMLILEEHKRAKTKEAILECIFYVSSNMGDIGGVFIQTPEEVILQMAEFFVNGLSIEMQIKSGKCLIIFFNHDLYPVAYYIYNKLRSFLHLFHPPHQELQTLLQTIRTIIG